MGTPFNNQWVLGRARSRRRQRTTHQQEGATHAPTGSQESRAATLPRNPRHGGGPEDARLGLAFMARASRKRPRWIDRDT